MAVIRPRPPVVTAPDLPDDLVPVDAARHGDFLAARIECTGETDLSHSSLEQCRVGGTAARVDLFGATLLDVEMTELRSPVLSLRDTTIRRLRIIGCRIGTLDLSDARVAELEIRASRIDYLTVGGARVEDALIAGTAFQALDLPQATLTRIRFDDCRVDEVDSRGMSAQDLDLRGLDALSYLDVNALRGATLTTRQVELLAPTFAASVGIDVRDKP
ncbi:pentapeptide repeat-containing protein [Microbacterium sp. NIBRBAC000506063]|uniref:pentapeptide repeat-containing protein n=1 Tax=Microbacterium sp. NIBRBAC000506063 TaxID=2734618 RepID=UPI001BB4CECC|nr:pentapeptide repeat-containing protein [Microbacterium sp. NIBRBAC000506063]QTV79686.1 pentapeptide repeat-containing protein [Microbacterium sp. NIBRBAC000506063]